MLHELYKRRCLQSLNTAYENGSWVHPIIDYIVILDNVITFNLNDGREIVLTAISPDDVTLTYVVGLPSQQQERPLREVRVQGADVHIFLHDVAIVRALVNNATATNVEWELTTTDDELRHALTNRFILNGKRWSVPIDIDTFNASWRQYDYTTRLDPEEDGQEPSFPTAPS